MRAGKGRARRFGALLFVCACRQSWALALLLLVLAGKKEECFRRGEKNVDTPAKAVLVSLIKYPVAPSVCAERPEEGRSGSESPEMPVSEAEPETR